MYIQRSLILSKHINSVSLSGKVYNMAYQKKVSYAQVTIHLWATTVRPISPLEHIWYCGCHCYSDQAYSMSSTVSRKECSDYVEQSLSPSTPSLSSHRQAGKQAGRQASRQAALTAVRLAGNAGYPGTNGFLRDSCIICTRHGQDQNDWNYNAI